MSNGTVTANHVVGNYDVVVQVSLAAVDRWDDYGDLRLPAAVVCVGGDAALSELRQAHSAPVR